MGALRCWWVAQARGKTIFGVQFLAHGIQAYKAPGILVANAGL